MDFLEIPILDIEWFWIVCLYWISVLSEIGELDICMIDYFTLINCVNFEGAFNELIFDQIFVMEALLEIDNCDLLLDKLYISSAISNSYYLCYNLFEWDTGFIFRFQVFGGGLIFDWDFFYEVFLNNNESYAFCWPCVTYFEYFLTTASSNVFYEDSWINATSIAYRDFLIPSDYQISFYYVLFDSKFYIYMNLLLFDNIINIFLIFINCFFYLIIYLIEIFSYVLLIVDLQYIVNIIYYIKEYKEIFNEFDYNIYVYQYKYIDMGFYIYFLFISIINLIVILINFKLLLYVLKLLFKSNFNIVSYFVNIKFIIKYTFLLLFKNYKYYLIFYPNVFKFNIPNNIFGVFNYTWYKIQKKIEYILFNNKNKICEYILFLYRNQKGFGMSFIGYISNVLIYCQMFSYLFFKELAFKWKVEIKYFKYAKDKQIKLNKTTKILLPSIWILDSYFRCYLNQIFIRYYKIILFSIQFSIKFFIYKILKFILKLFLYNKIFHIIIYYFINLNLCLKKVSKFICNKVFWYIYLKIKIYKIYFINMYLHFYIYKIITQFFFYDAYYLNVEMSDKYPYYQSKFIVNLFNFIMPYNKGKNSYLIGSLFILNKLFVLCFFKAINLSLFIVIKFIRYVYYILLVKLNILSFFYKKINIGYIIIFLLCLNLFFFKILYYVLFFVIIIYLFLKVANIYINKVLWLIGFFFCFIFDKIGVFLLNIIKFSLFLIKYIIIYPSILFFICFIIYNNTIIPFYFFDIMKHNYIYMYTYIYIILDKICIYNNIVFTLPEIIKNIFIFQENIYIEYLKINNIDLFTIVNKYIQIFKEIDLSKININLAIYNLFDFLDLIENIYNKIERIVITVNKDMHDLFIHYYYFLLLLCVNGITNIFWSYKFIVLMPEDAYIYIFLKLYLNTYKDIIYIFFYNIIYIDLPYYSSKLILYVYIWFNEYVVKYKFIEYFYFIIDSSSMFYINVNNYFFIKLIFCILYNFFILIKLINYFFDIYFYFFLDVLYNLKLNFITDLLYLNTNLDFFFNNIYLKFILCKDAMYSWVRFPIRNVLLLNKKQLIFQNYELKSVKMKLLIWIDNDFIRRKKFIDSEFKYFNIPFWLQIIQYKPVNFILVYYKLFKLSKVFYFFPFLRYFYWMYYIYIYCFVLLGIYFVFNSIYNKKYKYLYYSNTYIWDLLRKETIDNNFVWYKDHNKLHKYYNKEIIKNKENIKNKKNKKFNIVLNNFSFYNENSLNLDINKKVNKIKFNLLKKRELNKLMYLSFYNKYDKFRYIVEKCVIKLILLTNFSTINNFVNNNKNKINYYLKKNIYYNKYFNLSNQIKKKITFNFKNFMINNKYNLLYSFSLIEKKKYNLFSLYYYKKNISIPYIYEHWFEETLIDGPVLFNITEDNYNYLHKTIYNLYFYYKWVDNIIFNNKGSFYWFHKDATVCYIGQDKRKNKYYFNSSLDAYNNYYFIIILFMFIPLFIILNLLLSDLLHMYHTDADAFYIRLCETIVYWFFWVIVQFEFLDKNILTMIFAIMENHTNNIEHRAYIDYNGIDTLFNYEKLNKKIFPLYLYYKKEFILTQMYHLREEESNSVIFIILNFGLDSIVKFFDNIIYFFCNIFDVIYIKLNIFNFYSSINSIYCILKFFIYIYLIFWLKYKQNGKLNYINKFYLFNKIYFDLFNFSNKIINNYYKNVKIFYNNINKKII